MSSTRINWRELKERVDVLDILRLYQWNPKVTHNERTGGLEGACPIHDRENPDSHSRCFKVLPNARGFKCFGCGKGGSIIDLVAAIEEVTRRRAGELIQKWFPPGGAFSESDVALSAQIEAWAERLVPVLYNNRDGVVALLLDETDRLCGEVLVSAEPLGSSYFHFQAIASVACAIGSEKVVLVSLQRSAEPASQLRSQLELCGGMLLVFARIQLTHAYVLSGGSLSQVSFEPKTF